ncbi:MAG: S41 family peptidase [Gammaproteobacteria bacterium]|nr:S41 family peptidase [Gammaproteobacteria bacterium]
MDPLVEGAVDSTQTPLPLDQIKDFAEIFIRIKRNYVEPVSDEQLLDYAVEGMLNGLDPHSLYMKADRLEELNEGTTGRFGGLGMEVMMEDGFVKIVAPIDDTPAAEAGLRTGDLIIRINGKAISGSSLSDATEQMRGEPGTKVTLTILRETQADPFEVELERAVINVKTVRRVRMNDQIGYLRVSQFQTGTAESFRKELNRLRDKETFAGLILDLRNNPGGLLNSAVSIADIFITEGSIVSTKGRLPQNDQEFLASPNDMLEGKPLVVLINAGSASASEIVAGALQDHKRGLVLGMPSFGKGSVQTVMHVGEDVGIKLTTARYFTPSGRSIQAAGIVPDVMVAPREFKSPTAVMERLTENDLLGHLENKDAPSRNANSAELIEMLSNDYQLNEAFNLINALVLYQRPNPSPAQDPTATKGEKAG